jgi:uncharacterized protein
MIIPDINLLLYAYDSDSPFHSKAAAWWQQCLSETEPVGLATVVVFGFLRIGTNGRVFRSPLTPIQAAERVRRWQAQPMVQILEPRADHVAQALQLLETLGTAGNLVSDAQLAAITIEHGGVLHTADADFLRFRGLKWFNPISGVGSRGLGTAKRH